jgi:hypothetical protein
MCPASPSKLPPPPKRFFEAKKVSAGIAHSEANADLEVELESTRVVLPMCYTVKMRWGKKFNVGNIGGAKAWKFLHLFYFNGF